MITLSIDTASHNCAVALVEDSKVLARISETIGKGHAERLIGQISTVMDRANKSLKQIDRIAVNIGPGSFTGVRIGVATARALALALEKPAIGVSSLEAIGFETLKMFPNNNVIAVIDAGRGLVYRQDFTSGCTPIGSAELQDSADFSIANNDNVILAGPFALNLGEKIGLSKDRIHSFDAPDVVTYAILSETKTTDCAAKPLYLRDADAKPQSAQPLIRKEI